MPITLQGMPPSPDDEFYLTWGRETVKTCIGLANENLKQLVGLSTAMLGLTIAFVDASLMAIAFRTAVLILLLLALLLSWLGLLPYEGRVIIDDPSAIQDHKRKALRHKRAFLWTAATAFMCGMAIEVVAVISTRF